LAKCIYVSQSTLTVTLDHLEEMGLVRRERNTADKRVVTINLTDEGRREAATVSIPLLDFLSEKLSGMTDEDQVRVSVAMERLADLLDDNPDQKSRPKGRPDPL
jgi:DNA-binding MarR family transcriptional regulator